MLGLENEILSVAFGGRFWFLLVQSDWITNNRVLVLLKASILSTSRRSPGSA